MRVLQEGGKLAGNGIVEQTKVDRRTAYKKKDPTYIHHKNVIVGLFNNPGGKSKYPTKQEPRPQGGTSTHRIVVAKSLPQPQIITIGDIASFSAAGVSTKPNLATVPEERIKRFLKLVIGEKAEFKDWGGEKNDLFTNKLLFRGRHGPRRWPLRTRRREHFSEVGRTGTKSGG